jgi:hypothetical protein
MNELAMSDTLTELSRPIKADLPLSIVRAATARISVAGATTCNDTLSLKGKCLHPQSQALYIVRSSGNIVNSTEGLYAAALLNRERIC